MKHRGKALLAGLCVFWSACHAINGLDDYSFGGAVGGGGAAGVGGSGGAGGDATRFSISVEVVGLSTALTVRLGDETLTFDGAESQTFETALALGTSYAVTFEQPAGEQCASDNATGEVNDDVAVVITCAPLVTPLYPTGSDWLDYLDTTGAAPCDATGVSRHTDCIHGGEQRTVFVPGVVDCMGVAGRDTLDAFDWVCDDTGAAVRLISRGLKVGTGLVDLIDFSTQAFRDIAVEINTPAGIVTTAPAVWWSNPLATAGPSVTHDQAGTIYLVVADPAAGLSADGDQVALVVDPSITFTSGGGPALSAADVDFVWLEGSVDGDVVMDTTRMSVLRNISVPGQLGLQTNVALRVHGAQLSDGAPCVLASSNTGLELQFVSFAHCVRPADLSMGMGGYLREATAADFLNPLRIRNAVGFAVDRVVLSNVSGPAALAVQASSGVHITRLITASVGADGVQLECADCSLRGATATSSSGNGFFIANSTIWLESLLATNNATGINLMDTTTSGRNWVAVSQRSAGVSLNLNATNSALTLEGNMRLAAADVNCMVDGLSTGIDTDCTSIPPSAFMFFSVGNTSNMFAGKVLMDDASNTSDVAGSATYAVDLDWVQFDRETRCWGPNGGAFPSLDNQGACSGGNPSCRIWDWALRANNPIATGQNAVPDGNATATIDTQTFLINAIEALGDGVGDDDTLCESGERCLVMPNIGGYQGHGQPLGIPFTPGTITGVELFALATNGG